MLLARYRLKHLIVGTLLIANIHLGYAQNAEKGSQREKLSFNKSWKFFQGDIPFPPVSGHTASYLNAKAGNAGGAAAPNFDDHNWKVVRLPHDWAAVMPYDSTQNLSQGFRQRGFGWYRRQFKLDSADRGKHLELQFEGIATYATIWINGSVVHRNWCGYTSSYIDITPFAKYGDEVNTIAVRVDADAQEGWWYEGAGIYRDTWLIKRAPLHIITDGVHANPIKKDASAWEIPVNVMLENSGITAMKAVVEISLWDPEQGLVDKNSRSINVSVLDTASVNILLKVSSPQLWDTETPTLYTVKTKITVNGILQDSLVTQCGFRTIRFDADSGFYLNERPMKIKGVCNHQDHAGLGVAVPDAIMEFRLRKLKEMGVNAYRCSHNPPSASFLDLCDRMGMLVMDENRNFNSSPEYIRQLQWLIRRDRNHPSVILWSVFNEEPMQGTEIGYQMVRRMRHEVRKLDSTRPVTAAMNGGLFDPINVSQAVDVVGFNYQFKYYDRFHQENPTIPVTSSEDVSGFMVRGEYSTDTAKHILDAYDTQYAVWGTSHRAGWKAIAERPFMAGAFVWTGFDYHGEPSPFGWPSAHSFFGAMDLCGFPKTAFYLHQAQWVDDKPVLHLVPHWNWPADSIGKNIKIMVLSNVERIKLYLNGTLIGEQAADKYEMNTWQIPYHPGTLTAIGYVNGKEVVKFSVSTTGKAARLLLSPDRKSLKGDGIDAMPVTVKVLDKKGRALADANLKVTFSISGPGKIIGLGNGDPNSHEAEKGDSRRLFNGLAQLIVLSDEVSKNDEVSKERTITIKATADGVASSIIKIPVIGARALPYVPVVETGSILDKWLLSGMSSTRPDPTQKIASNDMNSWAPTSTGKLLRMTARFVMYKTEVKLSKAQQGAGLCLFLKSLSGKAEIWADDEKIGGKTAPETANFSVKLPQGKNIKSLTVLIEASENSMAGLGGVVEIR